MRKLHTLFGQGVEFSLCADVFSLQVVLQPRSGHGILLLRAKKTENTRRNDELSLACAPFVLPEGLRIVTFSLIR